MLKRIERQHFLDATGVDEEMRFSADRDDAIEVVVRVLLTAQAQRHGVLAAMEVDNPSRKTH